MIRNYTLDENVKPERSRSTRRKNNYFKAKRFKDIVIYGEDDFLVGLNLIINIGSMIDKASLEGNLQLDVFSDFQLLMIMIQQDEELEADMEEFLKFLFPDYQIEIGESDISFYAPVLEEDEDEISYYKLGMINLYNLIK